MKIKSFYFIALLLMSFTIKLQAQTEIATEDSTRKNKKQVNFIKVNLTGIFLKNYSIQYERSLSRKISVALAFRTMPSTTIPFKNQIIKSLETTDQNTKETIEKFRISNFAITPEIRFYLSKKGYGRGFYIAPFYRYASYETNDLVFTYENSASVESTITLSGKLTSNTGGLMFGVQNKLGKRLYLDLWLLGPHYGSATGNFSGVSSKPLTTDEQTDLRQELNDIDIPFTNKTVTVTSNGASVKLDGPWAGIRSGILLGFKF